MPALRMHSAAKITRAKVLPPLENGDRMDQKTFHERYLAMPEHIQAELIGGIVYMASPQKLPHGRSWSLGTALLGLYEEATPGVQSVINTTNIMGPESEPQPDCGLFIEPDKGGQVRITEDEYLEGAPEWLLEVSATTESIDLHQKKADYEKAGVREYVVVALRSKKVFWFVRRQGKFREMEPDADGIYRSKVFPGLWLDPAALLEKKVRRLLKVLRQGLASPEHQAFVKKLEKIL